MNAWKKDFGPFEGRVWLDCAHQGPLPQTAVKAVEQAVRWKRAPHKIPYDAFFEVPTRLRSTLATLVGGSADEIVLGNSATYGIQILIQGFPWESGDEVLVVDGDFPASVVPWQVLQSRGVQVRRVSPSGPVIVAEDFVTELSKRTRLICATWVSSFTGWRLDPRPIGRLARTSGALVVLNVSRGLGAIPLSVKEIGVDALTSCGFKWLLGPYGTGFAWLSRGLLDRLKTYQRYWLALQDPGLGSPEIAYGGTYRSKAGAFDVFNTANFLNFMPWRASLEYLLEQGLERVANHDRKLCERLTLGLRNLHYDLLSPMPGKESSAIVVFSHPKRAMNESIHYQLKSSGFDLGLRGGFLRASPHLYNTESDVEELLKLLSPVALKPVLER